MKPAAISTASGDAAGGGESSQEERDRKENWEQKMLSRTKEQKIMKDKYPEYKGHNILGIAEMVLQALVHISDRHYFGVSVLEGVLRGSKAEQVKKHHLDEIEEYNALSFMNRAEVTATIHWLIDKKYILQTKGSYPVLHITNRGLNYKEYLTPGNMKSLTDILSKQ